MNKTWILDLDGTIVKHNGYLIDGHDTLLEGVRDFFNELPEDDVVIITTARKLEYRFITEIFLDGAGIKYDHIIYGLPHGARVLINDCKPDGYKTAYAINKERDGVFEINENIND